MKRNRFTIIELMIVVSVIAILIGVLLPTLEKARQAAIAISCLNNVKQCMLGIQSYANDSNGILNTCENQNTSTEAGYGAWARLLTVNSYLPPGVVYCPLLRAEKTDTSRTKTLGILMAQNGWTKAWLKKEKIQNLFGKVHDFGVRKTFCALPAFSCTKIGNHIVFPAWIVERQLKKPCRAV